MTGFCEAAHTPGDGIRPMLSTEDSSAQASSHAPRGSGSFESRPPRTRTCLNGKLVFGDGLFVPDGALTLDCAIRDISEGGAKVILSKRQPLPPELYLIVVKHGVGYQAKVVWLNFPARGLKFLQAYKLDANLPPDLRLLYRLWKELSARSGIYDGLGH